MTLRWIALLAICCCALAQEPLKRDLGANYPPVPFAPQEGNTNAEYKALRTITIGEIVPVRELTLKRDAGTFTLDGVMSFLAPIRGKVTGAVFFGKGHFEMVPPIDVEKRALSQLTKEPAVHEDFGQVVFRFTDATYAEIKKASMGVPPAANSGGDVVDALSSLQNYLRKTAKYNLDGRILEDLQSDQPGGLFWAFIKGDKVSSKMLFAIDPRGLSALGVEPEEVALDTYEDKKWGTWAAFHFANEYKSGTARGSQYNRAIHIEDQKLDTTIDRTGKIDGQALTTFISTADGLRVVPFDLFHSLRVRNVVDGEGHPLQFIQENKDEDGDYFVILPKTLAKGEHFSVFTVYSGKDAVIDAGFGNYFPVARDDWYPNTRFGDYATYEMIFRLPKELTMVVSGVPGKSYVEGKQGITEWHTVVPQAVAGFNFATYKKIEADALNGLDYKIEGYANVGDSYCYGPYALRCTSSLPSMLKREVAEAQLAVQLYTDYYGPIPYQRLALTEQPAGNFGQAWPALIYLPWISFQQVYSKGDNAGTHGFTRAVAAHEFAHQWFGHAVGIPSYRDNWLSEGFAHFSASLYLQAVFANDPDTYHDFIKGWKTDLLRKNPEGKRPIDVGSVSQGYRLGNSKVGFDVNQLIYPKGGYILHMIRMMMWDPQNGDSSFKALMRDYVQSSLNKPTSTEDFKAALERHMTREMNQTNDGKMDWFFNEWVYGTYLPDYKVESSFTPASGGFKMDLKLTQSNVDDKFTMPVPIYLDFGNDKVIKLGAVKMTGNMTLPISVPLNGITEPPKRVLIDYNSDILCTINGK